MVSQEQVIDKLKECLDPELGVNIVDLGLVYDVNIEGHRIYVLMTLTAPGCPLDSYFVRDITSRLKTLKGVSDVSVELTFDPPWSPSKMSGESKDLLGFVN
jgi:metal-sulfur cluster biosynthetic enzyme